MIAITAITPQAAEVISTNQGDVSNLALSASNDIKINEIRSYPFGAIDPNSNDDQLEYSFVEIFNAGIAAQFLGGWGITDVDGSLLATLPSANLPGGAFLFVYFGSGSDELDFSDGTGTYYTNGDSIVFNPSADGIALYQSPGDPTSLVDAVFWSTTGMVPSGASYSDAVTAEIWILGDFVEHPPPGGFSTFGLCPDGVDHNISSDWREFRWGPYHLSWAGTANPIQISPYHGGLLDEYSSVLTWGSLPFADSFLVEVDNDSLYGSPEFSTTTVDTSVTLPGPLEPSFYYWRVRLYESGVLLNSHVTYQFVHFPDSIINSRARGMVGVNRLIQHKDTKLLCLWEQGASDTRPGCDETGDGNNGPWDGEHETTVGHVEGIRIALPGWDFIINGCEHCRWYCSRASIAMINNHFEGDLSQDRISYEIFFGNQDGPEGDLGHNEGTYLGAHNGPHGTGERWQVYEWAMGAAVTHNPGKTPFATIKAEIDEGRPIYVSTGAHASVLVGYIDLNLPGFHLQGVYINNPWPGASSFHTYDSWVCAYCFLLPAGYVAGSAIDQELSVTIDSDDDGIMDFDEQVVRNFHSDLSLKDTDKDQVEDKAEIRNYTFHDQPGYHEGHDNDDVLFPDVDRDSLRAENDCDSDGKDAANGHGDFDGGEDIDGDGHNPEVPLATAPLGEGEICHRETCQFDPEAWCIKVSVNKYVYLIGEPVYLVDFHDIQETHTFHENSPYFYELGPGCPDKVNDTPLRHDGSFSTNAGGHGWKPDPVELCPGGLRYLTVDVLSDFNYSEPDNTDPQTCWLCLPFPYENLHSSYSSSNLMIDLFPPMVEDSISISVDLAGPVIIGYSESQDPGNGFLQMGTNIDYMRLEGFDPVVGPIVLTQSQDNSSYGGVLAHEEGPQFPATAHFDVYFEVETMYGTFNNREPKKMLASMIPEIPPYGVPFTSDEATFIYSDADPEGPPVGRVTYAGHILNDSYIFNYVVIEKTHDILQGHYTTVPITIENSDLYMGGYDFLIGYDASALAFTGATPGQLLEDCGWEYFTYRYGADGNCGDACPSGLLRIIAIAETNNGPNHPSCYGPPDTDPHELAQLEFFVSNDRTFNCQYIPIRFFWADCNDNSVSSVAGDTLFVSDHVYEFEGTDITDSTFGFPTYFGIQAGCLEGGGPGKPAPIPFINYRNGGIDIVCSDSIDLRGDINVNGVEYEIADAVMFTNYFIRGFDAFSDHVEASTAASDVNADGIALSVADLVYLVRVITGDAPPYPKVAPYARQASASMLVNHSAVGISTNSSVDIGAGYFVFEHSGYTLGEPQLINGASDMSLKYSDADGVLKVLVYSLEKGVKLHAGIENIFAIPVQGTGTITLTEVELSDYYGNLLEATIDKQAALPTKYALHQNYPNPFNATTTIIYELPQATHLTIEIFNVLGQKVVTLRDGQEPAGVHSIAWDGADESGTTVSSGVYLYRLTTDKFVSEKKMMLLK
jgi:hypothetical protein